MLVLCCILTTVIYGSSRDVSILPRKISRLFSMNHKLFFVKFYFIVFGSLSLAATQFSAVISSIGLTWHFVKNSVFMLLDLMLELIYYVFVAP